MKKKAPYRVKERFIPGSHFNSPPITWRALQKKSAGKFKEMNLPFNASQGPDFYQLQIFIGGCRREDFSIHNKGHALIIKVKDFPGTEEQTKKLDSILNRPIILPHDLDSDFMSAEYHNGVLTIFFSKCNCVYQNKVEEIFVY